MSDLRKLGHALETMRALLLPRSKIGITIDVEPEHFRELASDPDARKYIEMVPSTSSSEMRIGGALVRSKVIPGGR